MFNRIVALLFATLSLLAAEPLKVGDPMPSLIAKDQHGADFELKSDTKFLLVSFDMSTGKKANKFLAEKGAKYLDEHKAVFVSNIHGMPAVGRLFALPKMRKYPHRIILGDEPNLLDRYPKSEDSVTVLRFVDGKIASVDFWTPETQALDTKLR